MPRFFFCAGADLGIVRLPFDPTVPALIVARPVAIVLAVGFVVFLIVRNQVVQREAVVASDEVDAGVRPAAAPFIQIARPAEARGEFRNHATVPLPEPADRVAVAAIPFRPQRGEIADLIASLAEVPGFGDQLDLRDDRVLMDDVEKRSQLVDFVQLAGQGAGQIEPQPVDVHVRDPIAQAVHDQLQHPRIAHVKGVAAAGEVHVIAGVFGRQPIVGGVIDAAEGKGWPEMASLGRMVVDDVQDHLDPGLVQVAHHGFELADHVGPRFGGITRGRGEKAERVVAPVIHQLAVDQVPVVQEFVHRQQLDRRHPQTFQIADRGIGADAGIGAALLFRHIGMQLGEALDVQFVDQRIVPRISRRAVVSPGEGFVDYDRQGRKLGVVALVERQIGLGVSQFVAPHFVRPARLAGDRLGIGIEQDFVGIEAMPLGRLVGPVDPKAINLPRHHVRQIDVPDQVGLLGQRDANRLLFVVGRIEQAELDLRRVFRIQGKIDAAAVPRGSQRIRSAWPDSHFHSNRPKMKSFCCLVTSCFKTCSEKGTVPICSEDCAKSGTVPAGSETAV